MRTILYTSILMLIFFILLSKFIFKDVLSPAFLVGLPWLVSLVLLQFTDFVYETNSIYFLYLVAGIIVFNIGYYIISISGKTHNRRVDVKNTNFNINNRLILLTIIIEILVLSYELIMVFSSTGFNLQDNLFYTLKTSETTTKWFIDYFRNFSIAFTLFIIISYFKSENFKNKRLILFFQMIIVGLNVLLTLGRTSIFLTGIASLTIYIIYKNMSNKKVLKLFLFFGIIGVSFFSLYNIIKYPYLLKNTSSLDVIKETLLVYTSSSVVNFQKWASVGIDYSFGGNTFRFISALLNAIGYDLDTNLLVNTFMNTSGNVASNVYTFYHYYASDFGLVYALIIQYLFGMIHGFLYKKMTHKDPFWVYLFSLSLYPLFMQFFQDQYVSLTSTWVQYLIYGLVLFKSKLFLKTNPE